MRIAVLSDIHSNLEALEAVLARAADEGAEATWVLGDLVGYGADPVGVVERLRALAGAILAGNHDLAATDRFDTRWFNAVAEKAIRWTREVIDVDTHAFLADLVPRGRTDAGLLVHGSVVDPAAEYITDTTVARASFDAESFSVCFFGHTHMPTMFVRADGGRVEGVVLADGVAVRIDPAVRYLLNPGSVGQPRDGDRRASFLMLDIDARTAVVHRVAYDIDAAQTKIRDAGLPHVLADRLAEGR